MEKYYFTFGSYEKFPYKNTPQHGGPHFWIHQIENERGIIFADGKNTAGQKHWSQEVRDWLKHCKERQYAPKFVFAE